MAPQQGTSSGHPIATLETSMIPRLPSSSPTLFDAKQKKNLSFETIGAEIGRNEVAAAAIFYGQAKPSPEDVEKLAKLLDIDHDLLSQQTAGWPDRGHSVEMPPKEPLMYRLFEIIQNYGPAYKAVMNEKFGDGIMSAISFSTKVEKETDDKGDWCKITLRGKCMGNTSSSSRPSLSSSSARHHKLKHTTATYEGMPRSPASPQLACFVDSPQSYQSYNTANVPQLAGPPFGHDRLQTETDEYGISLPLRRQHVRQLSELIDPTKLCVDDDYVKSPSGNLLGHADFCAREDRPLSLRERQERIRQQLNKNPNQSYAVNGIKSTKSSPTSSGFSMYDIPEEHSFAATDKKKLPKKKGGCWCF
ncbi:hypothetical protein B9Z65_218 [Elsinoe australis]|uniref:Cyanate hydratase n=1 Tax=Elsinoe australis TaxID=40998 RepID=A0A2P7Z7P5_9PEZI|nr:hypothetical protein B9Z65_218 [Elsinoe australis]